ncbi:anti-sigma factor antagonist [Streptomyces sp. NPDC047000]|uniref:anti-sigma factor antagonist n=1 Tax=Streptomyces sp. NPDC047000 TaxID=3155474 RepID=UPI0033D7D09C
MTARGVESHPRDVAVSPGPGRRRVIKALALLAPVLGLSYLSWRWLYSVQWSVWWIALPLVLAETYSLVDGLLFSLTVWRLKVRGRPPPPPEDATVDVFITTYDEPVDLVARTARAAVAMRHPHRTWVLDDGARPAMARAAEETGALYLSRGAEWEGYARHAKAGNLNAALMRTDGEFMLVLDADQVPDPALLEHTLGWFREERVALVQTPQYFTDVDDADPLGSQAPLFYGPIQQGKDGWNAAFFCGSNVVLRREALMQLGLRGYVRAVHESVSAALGAVRRILRHASAAARAQGPDATEALDDVRTAARRARAELAAGVPLGELAHRFQRAADAASGRLTASHLRQPAGDLEALRELGAGDVIAPGQTDEAALRRLADRAWSPLGAVESVRTLIRAVDVDRADEAQPVMPLSTISVTEDMATAMRLHAAGWRTVYHHEILAHGLAPEDLGSMLHQRLRWAQGTLQVMLRESPLTLRGLAPAQRLMYFATMWSYLSGYAALVYIAAPVIYLCFGVKPVHSFGSSFLLHLIPYLVVNQILFSVVSHGVRTWRGQQYSLALFPLWIKATVTAVANIAFGRPLGFVVTPKTRQAHAPRVAADEVAAGRDGPPRPRRGGGDRPGGHRPHPVRHRHRDQPRLGRLRPPPARRGGQGGPVRGLRIRHTRESTRREHLMDLTIDVTPDGIAVLRPSGRLDLVAAPQIRAAIDTVVRDGHPHVVVDLAGTGFLDSSGLSALVGGLKSARQAGGDLRIASCGPQVLTVLQLTNMHRVLHCYADVGTACRDR